jgi:hypothetical protein
MIDKDMIVLQNHNNSEMEVQDPCDETNPISQVASQAINIKVEEVSDAEEEMGGINIKVEGVSDAEEEEGPVPILFPKIKAEPEVRCMSLYVHCKQ